MTVAALEREAETFRQKLSELAGHEGKFAVIFGGEIIGFFDTYADALSAGYERAGLSPFLVKRITPVETLAYFTRDIG